MALAKAFIEFCNDGELGYSSFSLSVSQVAEKFLKYYWNQTIFHNLIQSTNPEKPPVIIQTVQALINIYYSQTKSYRAVKYNIIRYFLRNSLPQSYNQTIRKIGSTIIKDVAWRFTKLGDKTLDEVVVFDENNNEFIFSKECVKQIHEHAKELNDLVNYRWGLILESLNDSKSDKKKVFLSEDEDIDKTALLIYEATIDIDRINFKNIDEVSISARAKLPVLVNEDNPEERIQKVYQNYHFDKMGFRLHQDAKRIEADGIQMFAKRDGLFRVCFTNSNIYTQDQLDKIKKYGIDVHYDPAGISEPITWDISGCKEINNHVDFNEVKTGYYACEPLNEKDASDLVNYLVRIRNDKELENQIVESEVFETPITEVIKYNPLKSVKHGKRYIPVLVVIKRKVYQISSWKEAFKIIMFFQCYKAGRVSLLDDEIDSLKNKEKIYYIVSSKRTEENRFYVKFSPDLYIRLFQDEEKNYNFLNRIRKWAGDFELYILRADETDHDTDPIELIEKKTNSLVENKKYKKGSTKHLLASINARVLSEKEKFYIRVGKEFEKTVLIGDIRISEKEEGYLKSYMKNALLFMMKNRRMYHHDKVFAFGMVRVALKHYASNRFWPYVKEEYGVTVLGTDQSIINTAFKATMEKYGKLYFDEESNYVQNMCMHTFVCDKCADQLFDYIFEFWRVDLNRSMENMVDEDEKNYFDVLIEEIESNKDEGVQDIMVHTSMALKMNPIGCKNRFRRILKMIDKSYWDNADYSKSENRLSILFNRWVNNKNSLFYKDIKSSYERRRSGRGEKLLSRPNIQYDARNQSFSIYMPKQILRNCTIEERPIWRVLIDGKEFTQIEPSLIQGKASLYTKECSINIYKKDIYSKIEVLLQSNKANYYRRTIKASDCRFFNFKGRNVDPDYGYLSKDTCLAFVKKEQNLTYLNNDFIEKEQFDSFSTIYSFEPKEGDVFILPNNHALPVGRILTEGIVGSGRVEGTVAQYNGETYEITSDRERLFFRTSKERFNGTSIKLYDADKEIYFGKVSSKEYVEFHLDDAIEEIYGYLIDFHDYVEKDGIYRIELNIPGSGIRGYAVCYIKGFRYRFVDAPYVFTEVGEITFPAKMQIKTNKDWETNTFEKALAFNFEESEDNEYVRDRQLHVVYALDEKEIDLNFELPVLYWKYKKEDNWEFKKPNDIYLRDVPNRIYVSGRVNLSNAKMFIQNGDDLENSEINSAFDNDENEYYFRMIDIKGNLNRDLVSRILCVLIENKSYKFQNIVCRSFAKAKNITGDFNTNRIYGNYDIIGSSDYLVSIYYEDKKLDDNIPVENGKFVYEGDVKEGKYRIELYEVEEDESGFDSISIKINEETLELIDANNLEGKTAIIARINYGGAKFAPLVMKKTYRIRHLHKISYKKDLLDKENFFSWRYDPFDADTVSKFAFYKGDFCYREQNGEIVDHGKALVILDDDQNTSEALINVLVDDEYASLIYSPTRRELLLTDDELTRYERRQAKELGDDKYRFEIEIR